MGKVGTQIPGPGLEVINPVSTSVRMPLSASSHAFCPSVTRLCVTRTTPLFGPSYVGGRRRCRELPLFC